MHIASERCYQSLRRLLNSAFFAPIFLVKEVIDIFSIRKLEEACEYRVDFMWLLENGKAPDHSTLSRFRTGRCAEAVEDLFYQYVRFLEKQGVVDHKTVFIDGTKLESHAGRYTFVLRGIAEKGLEKARAAALE